MPWVIGLDEAGYGPNLGPLVQAAVATRWPTPNTCGWKMLDGYLRRESGKDERLMVADSKQVHVGPHGFSRLERGVLAILGSAPTAPMETLDDWLTPRIHPQALADLSAERWYVGTQSMPAVPWSDWVSWRTRLAAALAQLGTPPPHCWLHVTCPGRFNQILAQHGSKAEVLRLGILELLATMQSVLAKHDDDDWHLVIDKQGGRTYYASLLAMAFPQGWVRTVRETPQMSEYAIDGLDRAITICFTARAESNCWSVAVASMASKYVRELCMRQFNQYWCRHLPHLKPTAGYPVDAVRYFAAIAPLLPRLGLHESLIWRRK